MASEKPVREFLYVGGREVAPPSEKRTSELPNGSERPSNGQMWVLVDYSKWHAEFNARWNANLKYGKGSIFRYLTHQEARWLDDYRSQESRIIQQADAFMKKENFLWKMDRLLQERCEKAEAEVKRLRTTIELLD